MAKSHALKQLTEQLTAAGWRITQGKHIKAYCPCGHHILIMALTPSDPRSDKNLEARARRYLRECPITPSS